MESLFTIAEVTERSALSSRARHTSKTLKYTMPISKAISRGRKGKVAEMETTQNGLKSHSGHRDCQTKSQGELTRQVCHCGK